MTFHDYSFVPGSPSIIILLTFNQNQKSTSFELKFQNGDGVLDFTEFFDMYQKEHMWLKGKVVRYLHSFEKTTSMKDSEVLKRKSLCKPAFAIIVLSVIQVAFYYIEKGNYAISNVFRFRPYCRKSEIWRYITYMFVHNQKDHLHLWMNIM